MRTKSIATSSQTYLAIAALSMLALPCLQTRAIAQEKTLGTNSLSQEQSEEMQERNFRPTLSSTKVFHLKNVLQQNDANEVQIGLRTILSPSAKIYLAPSQNLLVISATPAQMQLAENIIQQLDVPKKKFRLTFTTVEYDDGKRVGVQHYAMTVVDGQKTSLKQNSQAPYFTGPVSDTSPAALGVQTQFQYVDLGISFDVTVNSLANGVVIRSRVEESSATQDKTSGRYIPVIHRNTSEGTSALDIGKSTTIASIDITGTTRHLDIEVVPELMQ